MDSDRDSMPSSIIEKLSVKLSKPPTLNIMNTLYFDATNIRDLLDGDSSRVEAFYEEVKLLKESICNCFKVAYNLSNEDTGESILAAVIDRENTTCITLPRITPLEVQGDRLRFDNSEAGFSHQSIKILLNPEVTRFLKVCLPMEFKHRGVPQFIRCNPMGFGKTFSAYFAAAFLRGMGFPVFYLNTYIPDAFIDSLVIELLIAAAGALDFGEFARLWACFHDLLGESDTQNTLLLTADKILEQFDFRVRHGQRPVANIRVQEVLFPGLPCCLAIFDNINAVYEEAEPSPWKTLIQSFSRYHYLMDCNRVLLASANVHPYNIIDLFRKVPRYNEARLFSAFDDHSVLLYCLLRRPDALQLVADLMEQGKTNTISMDGLIDVLFGSKKNFFKLREVTNFIPFYLCEFFSTFDHLPDKGPPPYGEDATSKALSKRLQGLEGYFRNMYRTFRPTDNAERLEVFVKKYALVLLRIANNLKVPLNDDIYVDTRLFFLNNHSRWKPVIPIFQYLALDESTRQTNVVVSTFKELYLTVLPSAFKGLLAEAMFAQQLKLLSFSGAGFGDFHISTLNAENYIIFPRLVDFLFKNITPSEFINAPILTNCLYVCTNNFPLFDFIVLTDDRKIFLLQLTIGLLNSHVKNDLVEGPEKNTILNRVEALLKEKYSVYFVYISTTKRIADFRRNCNIKTSKNLGLGTSLGASPKRQKTKDLNAGTHFQRVFDQVYFVSLASIHASFLPLSQALEDVELTKLFLREEL